MLMIDDDLEHLFTELENQGHDMTAMREAATEVTTLPVGDPTPVPGSLKLGDPTLVMPALPPMHQGLYDNAEGPFYLPRKPGRHYSVADLHARVTRLRRCVVALVVFAMVTASALIDIAVHWRTG